MFEKLHDRFFAPYSDIVQMNTVSHIMDLLPHEIRNGVITFIVCNTPYYHRLLHEMVLHEMGHILTVDYRRWYFLHADPLDFHFQNPTTSRGLLQAYQHEISAKAIENQLRKNFGIENRLSPRTIIEGFRTRFNTRYPNVKLKYDGVHNLIDDNLEEYYQSCCYPVECIEEMWRNRMNELRQRRVELQSMMKCGNTVSCVNG